jgi:3-oxoacyl-[acyl-carrier protein] reductase
MKVYTMNKIAIVTGVSRIKGIGRSICIDLAKQGIDIFFTYWTEYDNQMPWKVNSEEPDTIQAEIKSLGVQCEKMELDLSKMDAIDKLFVEVETKMGNASILINNATYSTQTSVENVTANELDKHYAVNVRATTLLISTFIKHFQSEAGGRIINLTSGQSLGAMNNEIAYAITKGAIETLTKTIAHEIAAKGITINAVNPGPTDTGWMNETQKEELLKQFPMKRIGLPKDAAQLICFLVSKEAEWITGQIIHSEGGFIR